MGKAFIAQNIYAQIQGEQFAGGRENGQAGLMVRDW